ncbi:tetratricopeptide repeat-containing sensor histidine kinase [Flavobacterium sedimenticola]|uniref:histidine kinase n=1 Tax=Flavobacterium sedimenticola TaxID=3043286 RepID=A0ABT6XLM5_9FLAO|nr:tetratricopeptide repeat protein [Flavobacterium sedimenticola]MDI9255988.1 tetratricopeptide repeat protein [Flavobacterium sedimenticola]
MIKPSHILLGLCLIIFWGCSQKNNRIVHTPTQDSIQKYLALANLDTLDHHKRVAYNDKALSFIDLTKNDSLTREWLEKINYRYLKAGEYKKFINTINYFEEKVFEKNNRSGIAKFHKLKGLYFHFLKMNDSAYYHYIKAEYIFKSLGNRLEMAKMLLNKSYIQNNLNDYLGAELSAKKANYIFKKKKVYNLEYDSLILLGNVYQSIGEDDKSIKSYNTALSLVDKFNKTSEDCVKSTCLNNIGNVYREQNNYKLAILYFKKSLKEMSVCKKDKALLGILSNNLGYCYLKTNTLKSPLIFQSAKKTLDSLGIKNESAMSDIYLSEFYIKKEDSIRANLHAESALKLTKLSKASDFYLTALTNAGRINPKKAHIYIQEFKHINDSLLFKERTARNQYYKIQLETEEINQQKNNALKQRTIIVIIAFGLLLITLLLIIIFWQRLKQKELKVIQVQQKSNAEIYHLMLLQKDKEEAARESERKRISMELHDSVMNKLSSIRLNLSVIKKQHNDKTNHDFDKQVKDIFKVETEIRNITHNLNEKGLDQNFHFEKMLEEFIDEQNKFNRIAFSISVDQSIDWDVVSYIKKMNLYRIIQEACHNINKHSHASVATISIKKEAEKIKTTISDNGIGFNASNPNQGIGLHNIRFRVASLKGNLTITSTEKEKTILFVSIPLD